MSFITGAVSGVSKFYEGRKMQRKGEELIENFEYNDLENAYENLQVSTLGSDMVKEQANITTSNLVDASRSGGTRGIAGNLGKIQAQNNMVSREVAANLDEQQKRIDYSAAGQDMKNQDMTERRQAEELAGYGQMMNVGMGMKYQGLSDVYNSFASQENMAMQAAGMVMGGMTGGMMGGGGGGASTVPLNQVPMQQGDASRSGGFGYGMS